MSNSETKTARAGRFVCMADIEATGKPHPGVVYDRANQTLTIPGGYDYEIDLGRCLSAADVLEWIYQVKRKTWMTGDLMCSLLTAFEVALGRIQPAAGLEARRKARE